MKSEFQAKYLQHLLSKEQNNEGFTLIELLVVIIIVGVLAAIALPSFLNQASRARATEGTNNVGALIRAQQVHRFENPTYANGVNVLSVKIAGNYYDYSFVNVTADIVDIKTDINEPDLKLVSGRIASDTNNNFKTVVCLSQAEFTMAGTTSTLATGNIVTINCPATYNKIN
jgi:type IV pilus assembly protein PilA